MSVEKRLIDTPPRDNQSADSREMSPIDNSLETSFGSTISSLDYREIKPAKRIWRNNVSIIIIITLLLYYYYYIITLLLLLLYLTSEQFI